MDKVARVELAGDSSVLSDIQALRKSVRQYVEQGATTSGYTADGEHADDVSQPCKLK